MKAFGVLTTSVALVALVGCGQKETGGADAQLNTIVSQDDTLGNDGTTTMAAPAPTSAQGFANAAAASDRFEIESSRLASASGQSRPVKAFAENMIKGHTASTAELKKIAAGLPGPVTPDDALNAEQQELLSGLQGKTGAELDRAYATAQVAAHEKTLATLKAYAEGGDTPALKAFANTMIPTVAAHLNTAKGLR